MESHTTYQEHSVVHTNRVIKLYEHLGRCHFQTHQLERVPHMLPALIAPACSIEIKTPLSTYYCTCFISFGLVCCIRIKCNRTVCIGEQCIITEVGWRTCDISVHDLFLGGVYVQYSYLENIHQLFSVILAQSVCFAPRFLPTLATPPPAPSNRYGYF